ncbi:50S ribosomal protein L9 [bacterium]|nr:50S ribosomal protein L9 [bacterium]
MRVILTENISSLGSKGDIKKVSDGYATNFLLPQNKAILATEDNIKNLQDSENKIQAKVSKQEDAYSKVVKSLEGQSIGFSGKTSDKNKLFQGIGTNDIIKEVKTNFNLDISVRWFDRPVLFKETGKHKVKLNLPNKQTLIFFINIETVK